MRSIFLALLLLPLTACESSEVFPFVSGIYTAEDEEVWMEVRVEDELVVFYDLESGSRGQAVRGEELHRDTLRPFIQEERGDACGDGLWYEAANLDDMLMFQLHTTFFSWPYLLWDCDQTHLILSDQSDTMACRGENDCYRFAPLAE